MHTVLRTLGAILFGLVLGSLVNGGLIALGPHLVPPPPGTDTTTIEGLKAALPRFEPRHFLVPFLAHALGTVVGAFAAAWLAPVHARQAALAVGLLFLAGGTANVLMLPAPAWFSATDLLLAYLPMAGAGWWLARRLRRPMPG